MKKFAFSLQKLLNYKEQVFDIERSILSEMNARLHSLREELETLQQELVRSSRDFNEKAAHGVTALEMMSHTTYLKALQEGIAQKKIEIEYQRQAIDRQTDKVREAKIEISTMEKLKEKKLEEYNYLDAKAQELFIEEFVSNAKATLLSAQ